MPKEKQEILDELTDMFYEVQPDEDYLGNDEETTESINDVQNLLDDESAPIEQKIEELVSFNSEWFPDGLPASEQKIYRHLLNEAENIKA
ncbi:hypothetical protein JUJ52_03135 [Virgibacillus sp. AGTR]|uniref:hypothetical protein n=1 Tax=Virgibacillus sp. AGTR TaxID=2812055 RepID=UPI001D16E6EB|nr:hypothetical protein [Virgibacillus sp. AGTR]MCC2248952.1 hypothetical protein [Virgibacillus sp. AGTR]